MERRIRQAEAAAAHALVQAGDPAATLEAFEEAISGMSPQPTLASFQLDEGTLVVEFEMPPQSVSARELAANRRRYKSERDLNYDRLQGLRKQIDGVQECAGSIGPGIARVAINVYDTRPARNGQIKRVCVAAVDPSGGGEVRIAPTANNTLRGIPPEVAPVLAPRTVRPLDLDPIAFEQYIDDLLASLGYRVTVTRPTADGGIDVDAEDPRPIVGGKMIVQCKRYQGNVGVAAVRELYGVLRHVNAAKGVLITTGDFAEAALEFAADKPLDLINGAQLDDLLRTRLSAYAD